MVFPHPLKAAAAATHGHAEGEVEVAFLVSHQIKGKSMETTGQLPVIVEVLIVVGLAILVEIVEARDLVITDGVDLFIHDLKPEGLVNTAGKELPLQVL